MASAWAAFACYLVMMLISYYYGQKHMPIQYNLKSIGIYTSLAVALFLISLWINTPYILVNMLLKTVLLIVFVTYAIKKDLHLNKMPFIKNFIK